MHSSLQLRRGCAGLCIPLSIGLALKAFWNLLKRLDDITTYSLSSIHLVKMGKSTFCVKRKISIPPEFVIGLHDFTTGNWWEPSPQRHFFLLFTVKAKEKNKERESISNWHSYLPPALISARRRGWPRNRVARLGRTQRWRILSRNPLWQHAFPDSKADSCGLSVLKMLHHILTFERTLPLQKVYAVSLVEISKLWGRCTQKKVLMSAKKALLFSTHSDCIDLKFGYLPVQVKLADICTQQVCFFLDG